VAVNVVPAGARVVNNYNCQLGFSAVDIELTAARTRNFGPAFGLTKLIDGTTKRFRLTVSVYVP
jgi:hypothetical protein